MEVFARGAHPRLAPRPSPRSTRCRSPSPSRPPTSQPCTPRAARWAGIAVPLLDSLRSGPLAFAEVLDRAETAGTDRNKARLVLMTLVSGGAGRVLSTRAPDPEAVL
jgi:hypothetical protein